MPAKFQTDWILLPAQEWRWIAVNQAVNSQCPPQGGRPGMRDLLEESRNRLMVLIALEALRRGFRAGKKTTRVVGWEREWFNCCYIDTPQGLVSWHYRDCFADLFEGLPPYDPLLSANGERPSAVRCGG